MFHINVDSCTIGFEDKHLVVKLSFFQSSEFSACLTPGERIDIIINDYVIYDGGNPSNHNVLYLIIKNFRDMLYAKSDCIDRLTKHVCSREITLFYYITSYKTNIDSKLESFIYDYDVIYCNDIHCNNDVHRSQINETCSTIISICLSTCAKAIPRAKPKCKSVPG